MDCDGWAQLMVDTLLAPAEDGGELVAAHEIPLFLGYNGAREADAIVECAKAESKKAGVVLGEPVPVKASATTRHIGDCEFRFVFGDAA